MAEIELKEGTRNNSKGINIPGARLYIGGKGYLNVSSPDGPAIYGNGIGARGINITGGTVELHTGNKDSAVIDICADTIKRNEVRDIIIEGEAKVKAYGGCKGFETERDRSEFVVSVAEGSFVWNP